MSMNEKLLHDRFKIALNPGHCNQIDLKTYQKFFLCDSFFSCGLMYNIYIKSIYITSGPTPQVASPAAHMYACSSKLRDVV